MSIMTILWWVFWALGLFYNGYGFADATRRYWAASGVVGWLLLGYLGYVVLHVK